MFSARQNNEIKLAQKALLILGIAASFGAAANTVFSLEGSDYRHMTSEVIPSLGGGHWMQQNRMLDASGHNVSGCLTRQIPGADSARTTCFGTTTEYAGISKIAAVNGGVVAIGQRGNMNSSGVCSDCSAWVIMLDDSGNLRWSKRLGDTKFHFDLSTLLLRSDGTLLLAGSRQDRMQAKEQAWIGRLSDSGELVSEFSLNERIGWFSGDFGYGAFEATSEYKFNIADMTAMPDGGFAVSGSVRFDDADVWAGYYIPESSNWTGFVARFDNAAAPVAVWAKSYRGPAANAAYDRINSNANGEMALMGRALPTRSGALQEQLLTKVGPDGITMWSLVPIVASHTSSPIYNYALIDSGGNVFLQSSVRTSYSPVFTETIVSSFSASGTPRNSIYSTREQIGSEYGGYGGYGERSDETYPVGMYLSRDRQLVVGGESHSARRGLTVDLTSTDSLYTSTPFTFFTDAGALVTNSCLWSAPEPNAISVPMSVPLFQENAITPVLETVSRSTIADWPSDLAITYMHSPKKVPLCSPSN